MRVVVISPYVPFPGIDHAGGAYLLAYLERAARRHRIELFAPWSPANARGAQEHGTSAGVHLLPVPAAPRSALRRRWWNARNAARGLTPGWQVLRAFGRDRSLAGALAGCDLLEVHWSYLLPVLDRVQPPPAVLVHAHDVVAQVFERRAATAAGLRRVLLRLLARRIRTQEAAYLNRTCGVLVFSDKDVALLRDAGLTAPAHVVDPLVAVPAQPAELTGRRLLFAAAMHRPENADAARWFLDTAWPLVRQAVPDAELVIAGSGPPEGLAAGVPGVVVTGFVADLDALHREARAAVVPLRSGAGLKFKVAQAMLWGLPVVTTPVGAEGIVERSGREAFAAVSDDPAELARACVEMLTDVQRAQAVGARARAWAMSAYDTAASIEQVLDLGESLVSAGGRARA